jgi:uracil-DNA glycosylase
LNNCSNYFDNEIKNLQNLKVIITLGKIAFDNCVKFYKKNFTINKKLIFKHGAKYNLPDGKILISSYHPSPRNVNTKVIDTKKMVNLFKMANKIL